VDRLEKDLGDQVQVLRLSVSSEAGRAAAARYGVRAVPTFVIFDGDGLPVAQSSGLPSRSAMKAQLALLIAESGE
jgi:thioredoxin-like negative regulator of GroEL